MILRNCAVVAGRRPLHARQCLLVPPLTSARPGLWQGSRRQTGSVSSTVREAPRFTAVPALAHAASSPAAPALQGSQGFEGAIVMPLPGVLLTRDLFAASRLQAALGAAGIDEELCEDVIVSSSSLDGAAEALLAGLDARHGKNTPAVLVGHSYGGYVALEFARRFSGRLSGLVLVSTQCRADTPGATGRREDQVVFAKSKGTEKLIKRLVPMLLSKPSARDANVMDSAQRMATQVGADAFERQMLACAGRPDQRGTLAGLCRSLPVLVVAGAGDKLIPPRCAQELRGVLSERAEASERPVAPWRVESIKGSGHLVPLEQPDMLHKTLEAWAAEVRDFRAARSHAVPIARA